MNLDDLLSDAMAEAAHRDMVKKAAKATGHVPTFRDQFANPANWHRGQVVAVVHQGPKGQTLLGAFVESIHRTGARKLERADGPLAVDRQEFVTGAYWLPPAETVNQVQVFAEAPPIEDRELIFDVVLEAIQALAYDAMIRVRLDHGWIRSVQLAQATQFACPTNRTHFFLPKRIEVLDAMSFDNKVELKTRLKI